MKLANFPWSSALAGLGSGVIGFGLAAFASGLIHVGTGDSCRVAHRHETDRDRCIAVNDSPCCCEGRTTQTADGSDDAPLELTALRDGSTAELASPSPAALRASFAIAPRSSSLLTIAATPPSAADERATDLLITPTSVLGADPAETFAGPTSSLASRTALGGPTDFSAGLTGFNWSSAATGSAGLSGAGGVGGSGGSGGSTRLASAMTAAADDESAASMANLAALVLVRDESSLSAASGRLDALATTVTTTAGSIGATRTTTGTAAASSPQPSPTAAIPEPASLVMALVGMSLAGGVAWRRRQG